MAIVRQDLVDYLRKSCSLLDPTIETDSAYKFTDTELESMISNVVSAYCAEYSLLTLPSSYSQAVVLVARKEVLWSLAFANAPYIEWQLDETRMKENVRFDHYAQLIDATEAEIRRLAESGNVLFLAQVKLGDIYISAYNGTARNYNAAVSPSSNLVISSIGARTVELDWDKFINGLVSCFNYYALYISAITKSNIGPSLLHGIYPINRSPAKLDKYGRFTVKEIGKSAFAVPRKPPLPEVNFASKVAIS